MLASDQGSSKEPFPKIRISLVGKNGTFLVDPWQSDFCKKLTFVLCDH